MGQFDGQPSIRWSLRGLTEEGDEAWLIRGIARKLYRCPGCHGEIEIGDDLLALTAQTVTFGTEECRIEPRDDLIGLDLIAFVDLDQAELDHLYGGVEAVKDVQFGVGHGGADIREVVEGELEPPVCR